MNCGNCGTTGAPGAKFCGECGQAFGEPTEAAAAPTPAGGARTVVLPPLPQAGPYTRVGVEGRPAPPALAVKGGPLGMIGGLLALVGGLMQIGGLVADFDETGLQLEDLRFDLIVQGGVAAGVAVAGLLALCTGLRGRLGPGMVLGSALLVVGARLDLVLRATEDDSRPELALGFHLLWAGAVVTVLAGLLALIHLAGGSRTRWARPAGGWVLAGLGVGAVVAAGVALPWVGTFGETAGSPFDDLGYASEPGALALMGGAALAGILAATLRPGTAGGGIAMGAAIAPGAIAAARFYELSQFDGRTPAVGLILLTGGSAAFLILGIMLAATGTDRPPPPASTPPPAWTSAPGQRPLPPPPPQPRPPGGKLTVDL